MIGNLLKTETSQKKTPLKALGKWKTSKNSLVRKFTKLFNLIVLIKQKTFQIHFMAKLLWRTPYSQSRRRPWWIASYIFSVWLNPVCNIYIEWATHKVQRICVPDVENKKIINPILYFMQTLQNLFRVHQWTNPINMNYSFNIPSKF